MMAHYVRYLIRIYISRWLNHHCHRKAQKSRQKTVITAHIAPYDPVSHVCGRRQSLVLPSSLCDLLKLRAATWVFSNPI